MKKILSLSIIFVMIISSFALTSCDEAYKNVLGFVREQLENSGIIVRTTVTEEEWNNAMNSTNFTVIMESEDEYLEIVLEDTKMKVIIQGTTIYFEEIDDNRFMIMQLEDGTWASTENGLLFEFLNLGEIIGDFHFDEFTYDAEKGAYIASYEEIVVEFKFENAVLVNGSIVTVNAKQTYRITNGGTTVIDIPEYRPYDPETMGGIGSTGGSTGGTSRPNH